MSRAFKSAVRSSGAPRASAKGAEDAYGMAGDGTSPAPRDRAVAQRTQERSGACRSSIRTREPSPNETFRWLNVQVRHLCREAAERDAHRISSPISVHTIL